MLMENDTTISREEGGHLMQRVPSEKRVGGNFCGRFHPDGRTFFDGKWIRQMVSSLDN